MNAASKETKTRPRLVIEAKSPDYHYWADLWRFRELLWQLSWRDIQVRYKQAVLGVVWALIQPAVQTLLLSFVFGKLARMPSGDQPYFFLVLSGILPWQLFSGVFSGVGSCLVGNANLISKVYFPRLLMPLAASAVALVDMSILLALCIPCGLFLGISPGWHLLLIPAYTLGTLLIGLGAGLWIAALTVKFRDFKFITPFILQIGVFATPVGYRADLLPEWRGLLALNPLTAMIDGFRWCLSGGTTPLDMGALLCSVLVSGFLCLGGLWYFRLTERQFADVI